MRRRRVLLGCSGSVATVKLPELVVALTKLDCDVRVVLSSEAAMHFFIQSYDYDSTAWRDFIAIGGYGLILSDKDEWAGWRRIGDPVLHIDLRRWADVFVLAPASANTFSKCKLGLCDSLLLSVYRSWDFETKPVICAPAMNTTMWDNLNLQITEGVYKEPATLAMYIIPPAEKTLACGDVGKGAMASVTAICDTVVSKTDAEKSETQESNSSGEKVLHPALQPGWITKYKWNPLIRIKYLWRYSRICVRYKPQLLFASVIITSVATGFAMMWLMSKYGHWQLLREYEEQKGKLVDKLREKAESYKRIPDNMASKVKVLAQEAREKAQGVGFSGSGASLGGAKNDTSSVSVRGKSE